MTGRKPSVGSTGRGGSGLINFGPTGPVADAYFWCMEPIAIITGPVGSGKTYKTIQKIFHRSTLMPRDPSDGVRKYILFAFRADYRTLWRTTIRSWLKVMPQTIGEWTGGLNQPAQHIVTWNDGKGPIRTEVQFQAIPQDMTIEDALRGAEPTDGWISEIDTEREELANALLTRLGRFPPEEWGARPEPQLMGDMNMPFVTSWAYKRFIDKPAKGIGSFIQPGGRAAEAENITNLPGGRRYYERQVELLGAVDPQLVRRMVDNKPGLPRSDLAIYGRKFNPELHTAKTTITPHNRVTLRLGVDGGRNPAVVIGQKLPDGRWWILAEVIGVNVGVGKFSREVKRVLAERFTDLQVHAAWHDPSSDFGSATPGEDERGEEQTFLEMFEAETGIWSLPADGNNRLTSRDAAVDSMLERVVDGQMGLLIDPSCETLIEGLAFGYQMNKTSTDREASGRNKNKWSHVVEALQYLLLSDSVDVVVFGRPERLTARGGLQVDSEYDPFA